MNDRFRLALYLPPLAALGAGMLFTWLTYDYVMTAVDASLPVSVRDDLMIIVYMVAMFSTLLFVVVVVLGYFFDAWLKENAARRRLAMFPERNLNPVISLGDDGAILYANPSAARLQVQLDSSLLPPTSTNCWFRCGEREAHTTVTGNTRSQTVSCRATCTICPISRSITSMSTTSPSASRLRRNSIFRLITTC